ncbi:MAG: DUF1552 domain-containing protein [Prosthecobacter sp.]|uniref:DUF1552 domain-containing protein n=1 Tax=Prosthecobacter sp. TaxID=1965333 RepID=UPI00390396EB
MTHIARTPLSRRSILRSAGAFLALPMLDAMQPVFGREKLATPRRLFAICTNLGILDRHLYPAQIGRDYEMTTYLETLKDFREQFTLVSGTSHLEVAGGHSAEFTFLTAAPHPGTASFRNSVSLDQFAAERIGHETRVAALPLGVAKSGNQSLSVTPNGVMLPAERSPSQVFRTLFVEGDATSVEKQIEDLRTGRSILDSMAERSAALQKQLGGADRDRMDQYFTAVREVERRLLIAEEWERKPKPKVSVPAPKDGVYLMEQLTSMYDLAHLALSTDSTRLITLMIRLDGFSGNTPGVTYESHNLSHHTNRPEALTQLKNLELAEFRQLAAFLTKLKATQEGQGTLLDQTQVLYGSSLGNANSHDNKNLPIILAGGGFKHGQHLAFNKQHIETITAPAGVKRPPAAKSNDQGNLCNLYVSMLQRLGIETDKFASSTSTLKGLEMAE